MSGRAQRSCCDELADAILDGRYDAAPELWERQGSACARCQHRLEGYRSLRSSMSALSVGGAPDEAEPTPADASRAVRELEHRYAQFKRGRRLVAGLVLLGVAGVGAALFASQREPRPAAVEHRAALTRAQRLLDVLRTEAGVLDPSRLDASPLVVGQFEEALRDPDATVRAAATLGLALARQSDRIPRLGTALRELSRAPEEVRRRYGDQAGALSGTLATNRTTALCALLLAATHHRSPLDQDLRSTLLELAQDPERVVRESALVALAEQAVQVPEETIWSLLREDAEPNVRHLAACVILRSGNAAQERLAQALLDRPDARLEAGVLGGLEASDTARRLARSRFETPATDLGVLLAASAFLARAGETFDRELVVRRGLASLDPAHHLEIARLARAGNWTSARAPLQELWRAAHGVERLNLGGALVGWDVERDSSLDLAFEILEDEENLACGEALERLQQHRDSATRQRAAKVAARWRGAK